MEKIDSDILIIGSGLAGLTFALKMADQVKVTVLAKTHLEDANTALAQGGIAAVAKPTDSFAKHIEDTLVAGAGLCHSDVVRNVVEQAPDRIQDLINWGVQFSTPDLGREGGHSQRRIFHVKDQTGYAIHQALLTKAKAHPNINFKENHFAIDLIINKQVAPFDMNPATCIGAYVFDINAAQVRTYTARIVVLATGGAGKAFLYTSNWSGATGDGIAMAYRAGARVANMEFTQFHPTCLYHPQARNFLISEAVRGEGGILINSKGEDFMKKYHPLASLAPRDITARSIDAEMKRSGSPCVHLDITSKSREFLESRFPQIFQKCMDLGIDISKTPIPVVPAAHFTCGGIITNPSGQTDITNLYAVGETACTGLHGANRLASNSLLECLATSHNATEILKSEWNQIKTYPLNPPPWISPQKKDADEMIVVTHIWEEIRNLMWNYVGIVRSNKRLSRAKNRLQNILNEIRDYYSGFQISSDLLELRNIAIVADLTVRCALKRKESRGIHFNLDYPPHEDNLQLLKEATVKDSVLIRGMEWTR